MSSSRRWFRYVADDGVAYGVEADESNTELTNLVAQTSLTVAGLLPLPKGYSPRYVDLEDASGNLKRKCIILTQARYAALSSADSFPVSVDGTATTVSCAVVRKTAEKIRRQPKDGDTGLNDGDNP